MDIDRGREVRREGCREGCCSLMMDYLALAPSAASAIVAYVALPAMQPRHQCLTCSNPLLSGVRPIAPMASGAVVVGGRGSAGAEPRRRGRLAISNGHEALVSVFA